MRLSLRLLTVSFFVWAIGTSAFAHITPTAAAPLPQAAMSEGCQELNDPSHDRSGAGEVICPLALWAGETIIVSADNGPIPYTIRFLLDGNVVDSALVSEAGPGTIIYEVPQDITPSIRWDYYPGGGGPAPVWDISCQAKPIENEPPGCEHWLPLTANAAVGRFTADAPTYWAPGQPTEPPITIPAGKTAWVLGMDAGGDYYQIVWACDTLWVPASAIGPNTGDPIWDGVPLPTDVVQ